MSRVQETMQYLIDFICNVATEAKLSISPETIRKSKANDPRVTQEVLIFIVSFIGQLQGFRLKPGISYEDAKSVLCLYLSLHENPFLIANGTIDGSYDIDNSRSLFKILCWLLFSNQDYLRKLDTELIRRLTSLEEMSDLVSKKAELTLEKSQEKQQASVDTDSMSDLLALKSVFLYRTNRLAAEANALKSSMNKLQASLQRTGKGTGSMTLQEHLTLLSSPSEFMTSIQTRIEKANEWTKCISLRKTALEWMNSCVKENLEVIGGEHEANVEEAFQLGQSIMNTKLVQFQEIYNNINIQLEEMHQWADKVRSFGQFWASTTQQLGQKPEYRKALSAILAQKTNHLKNKYNKQGQGKHVGSQGLQKQTIDLFKVLVDMKTMKKPQTNTRVVSAKIKQEADVDQSLAEYKDFLKEVEAYLKTQGIVMINKN